MAAAERWCSTRGTAANVLQGSGSRTVTGCCSGSSSSSRTLSGSLLHPRRRGSRTGRGSSCSSLTGLPAFLRVSLLAVGAVAFDVDAHDAIGQTAASAMDMLAIKQVKRLLEGKDVSDVAGWGHKADDVFPGLTKLHFQEHTGAVCGPKEQRTAKCQDNICLLQGINHLYFQVLKDEGKKVDVPPLDFFKVDRGLRMTDADRLKLLINLIGDLHQPFHVGFVETDMGRKIKVKFQGKEVNLYDLWDSEISKMVREKEASFWLSGWTHVRRLADKYPKEKELWKKDGPAKSFQRWLDEMVDFSCDVAMKHPMDRKPLWGEGSSSTPVDISGPAYAELKQRWLQQILLAGGRTAIVLNEILDDSAAQRLSQGTKMKTKDDIREEEEKKEWEKERAKRKAEQPRSRAAKVRAPWDFNAFLINLAIASITVPTFLVVLNYGFKPSTYADLLKSLRETSANGRSQGNMPPVGNTKRWD